VLHSALITLMRIRCVACDLQGTNTSFLQFRFTHK